MGVIKVNQLAWGCPEAQERAGAQSKAGNPATQEAAMFEAPRDVPPAVEMPDVGEALRESLEKLNAVLEHSDVRVGFYVHEETGRLVVQVVNQQTGEVVKEIPPKKVLETVAKIMEFVGLLLDEKV